MNFFNCNLVFNLIIISVSDPDYGGYGLSGKGVYDIRTNDLNCRYRFEKDILHCPVYCGYKEVNGELIKGDWEPYISLEEWNEYQVQLSSRPELFRRQFFKIVDGKRFDLPRADPSNLKKYLVKRGS